MLLPAVNSLFNGASVNNTVDNNSLNSLRQDIINSPELQEYIYNTMSGDLDFQRTLQLQQNQFDFNANEAKLARDEYRDLSNTAYQRAVADLKNAGLNPVLAALGNGASAYAYAAQGSSASQYSLGNQAANILSTLFSDQTKIGVAGINALSQLLSTIMKNSSNERIAISKMFSR